MEPTNVGLEWDNQTVCSRKKKKKKKKITNPPSQLG